MSLHVGQKVTMRQPIPSGLDCDPSTILPEFGAVYQVRDIEFYEGSDWVRLDEIRNPDVWDGGRLIEPWFAADGFRPIITRKTDISIFTALLDGVKQGEPV